jgi:hypothetical protein
MPIEWPENKICHICENQYKVHDVIMKIPFDIDTRKKVYMFLNRKLNNDLTLNIFKYINNDCYGHAKCIQDNYPKPNYCAYWYLYQYNVMYLSNSYGLARWAY